MKPYGSNRDQKTSYLAKEELLKKNFTQVSPMDFYRDLFSKGSLQPIGAASDGRGCAIFRFQPDKSTYKKMKDRISGKLKDEFWRDSDELMQQFIEDWGAVPLDELNKRYDALDKAFNAGEYRKPGKAIEMNVKFDQRVHDDLNELGEAIGKKFAIMAPISYFGKKANGTNARYLHAITLDLDGVGVDELKSLIKGLTKDSVIDMPAPTYLVNSGHGMHLYYILEEPVPLYNYVKAPITDLKNGLISNIWNKMTSTITKHKDDQPCLQMYRVVGSQSKLGAGYPATAYKVGGYTTIEALRNASYDKPHIPMPLEKYRPTGSSGHDLEYWKVENPDWYRRVVLKEAAPAPSARQFPWLYESLKNKINQNVRVGTRYNSLCVLFADAAMSNIPYDEAYAYASSMVEPFNDLSRNKEDEFTQDDVDCAAKYYATDFGHYMTLDRIESMTDIRFERNKRNGRKKDVHLKQYIPGLRQFDLIKDTRFGAKDGNPCGRPSAELTVREYLQQHPAAKKAEVIKSTGLDKKTVYKWYDKIKEEVTNHE